MWMNTPLLKTLFVVFFVNKEREMSFTEQDFEDCPEDDNYKNLPNEDGINEEGINVYDWQV